MIDYVDLFPIEQIENTLRLFLIEWQTLLARKYFETLFVSLTR